MLKDIFTSKKNVRKEGLLSYFELLDNFGVGVAFISPQMEILALNKIMKRWFPNVSMWPINPFVINPLMFHHEIKYVATVRL